MTAINTISDEQTKAFAIACYDTNSIEDLRNPGEPDETDMKRWGISAEQWNEAIAAALTDRLEDE